MRLLFNKNWRNSDFRSITCNVSSNQPQIRQICQTAIKFTPAKYLSTCEKRQLIVGNVLRGVLEKRKCWSRFLYIPIQVCSRSVVGCLIENWFLCFSFCVVPCFLLPEHYYHCDNQGSTPHSVTATV